MAGKSSRPPRTDSLKVDGHPVCGGLEHDGGDELTPRLHQLDVVCGVLGGRLDFSKLTVQVASGAVSSTSNVSFGRSKSCTYLTDDHSVLRSMATYSITCLLLVLSNSSPEQHRLTVDLVIRVAESDLVETGRQREG